MPSINPREDRFSLGLISNYQRPSDIMFDQKLREADDNVNMTSENMLDNTFAEPSRHTRRQSEHRSNSSTSSGLQFGSGERCFGLSRRRYNELLAEVANYKESPQTTLKINQLNEKLASATQIKDVNRHDSFTFVLQAKDTDELAKLAREIDSSAIGSKTEELLLKYFEDMISKEAFRDEFLQSCHREFSDP